MSIDPSLAASLKAIGALMNAAVDPWWIITSAAVALHGADAGRVADVDVMLSVRDAASLLPTIGVGCRSGSGHADFRSAIFGTWTVPPLPVEFMADFRHRVGTDWLPVELITRERMELEGEIVFVPGRAELCELLRRFGRPKDIERAARLAALAY